MDNKIDFLIAEVPAAEIATRTSISELPSATNSAIKPETTKPRTDLKESQENKNEVNKFHARQLNEPSIKAFFKTLYENDQVMELVEDVLKEDKRDAFMEASTSSSPDAIRNLVPILSVVANHP